jgi:pyruvate formate lyase activating enzyme
MTLSGGEALAQGDFSKALLTASQEAGVNTAIETTGFVPWPVIEDVLPWLDLALMDIKHMDSAKHQAFTSQPNGLILENARRMAETGQKMIIRVPVVPGFNDTPQEIGAIAAFAASLPGVQEIHLLPYHRLGQDKYAGLGREYTLKHLTPPAQEQMLELCTCAEKTGLRAQIGG